MAVIIEKQKEIQKYFDSPAKNQSLLKGLINGLDGLMATLAKKRKDEEENKPTPDYFLIGGAVDTILTSEEGEYEKQYYVSQLDKKPSDKEVSIVESVFHELIGNDVDISDMDFGDSPDAIMAAADEFEWQMRWKAETRLSKLIIAGEAYYEDLKRSVGKEILSSEQHSKILDIVSNLRTSPRTSKYFNRVEQADHANIDFYYQMPIYFIYEGEECKALLDLVVVHKDPAGNVVRVEPIDLKTMSGSPLQFIGKVKQHRYDIQAAWYVLALSSHFNISMDLINRFKFIVESTTGPGNPLVFRISSKTLQHGISGAPAGTFAATESARELYYPAVKGYAQLMLDYIYYEERDFKEDKALESGEIIEIDWVKGVIC